MSATPEATAPVRRPSSRLRVYVVLAVIALAIGFLLWRGLGDATTFFRNADEAVADRDELGTRRFRLQGTVVPGSVNVDADSVDFSVEWECVRVPVSHQGDPPELFKDGIPVVLEGAFAEGSDVFESDRILVKHTSEYRTEEADRLELAEREACPA